MSSYWQKRQNQLDSSLEKDEAALKKRILKAYEREAAKLDREIAAYYQKYGRDNVIEYARLFEQLSADDMKLLIERMDDFAKKYPQYADLMPVRESVYKLNRLEGLKESVLLHQYEIGAITNAQLQEHLSKLYFTNSKAAAKAVGLTENESIIKNFVNTAWTGSKDYSQRIWQNADKLAEYLNNDIAQGFARGDSYERLTQQVRSRFINVSKNDAYRLIYTEGTYVMNEAQARIFEQDFEEYEYLTAGDGKVCSVCSALSGRRFRFSQRQQGANFPPMHPWCRCHFNPVVDDWDKWLDDYEKRHSTNGEKILNNIYDRDTINKYFKSTSKHDFPITEESIKSVSDIIIDDFNQEQNKKINIFRRKLLEDMQQFDTGIEGAYSIPLTISDNAVFVLGEYGKTKIADLDTMYYAVHNHPDNGVLTITDLYRFLERGKMVGLEAITNGGKNVTVITKTLNSDPDEYTKYLDSCLNEFTKKHPNIDIEKDFDLVNDFFAEILKEAKKYGYRTIIE